MELIGRVCAAAREKGVDTLDEVIMVGGSSRIPLLLDSLESALGLRPRLVEPDLAVAKGAAIRAHQLAETAEFEVWARRKAGTTGLLSSRLTVTPAAPRAIGILVEDSYDSSGERRFVEHLITANTALPADVTRRYATIVDQQESVRIQIYEQAGAFPSEELAHNRLVIDGELSGFASFQLVLSLR